MAKDDGAIEEVGFEHRNQDRVDDLGRIDAHEVKHENRFFMRQELQHLVDVVGLWIRVQNHDFRLYVGLCVIRIKDALVITKRIVRLERRESVSAIPQGVDQFATKSLILSRDQVFDDAASNVHILDERCQKYLVFELLNFLV